MQAIKIKKHNKINDDSNCKNEKTKNKECPIQEKIKKNTVIKHHDPITFDEENLYNDSYKYIGPIGPIVPI